jgi:LPXTG-site transpeptidase (sortase) family protein
MNLTAKGHKLRTFNNILSIFVLLLGIYIAVMPLLPVLQLWWKQKNGVHVPYSGTLSDISSNAIKDNKPKPKDNRLVIPGIDVDTEIKEGPNMDVAANEGVWRRPNGSSDPLKSNMVLAGHRFAYTHPYGAFYHLDKVKVGDALALYWNGQEYIYKVSSSKVVEPTATYIENPTSAPTLTLYTCTPIWSAKQRLVITAEPMNVN